MGSHIKNTKVFRQVSKHLEVGSAAPPFSTHFSVFGYPDGETLFLVFDTSYLVCAWLDIL